MIPMNYVSCTQSGYVHTQFKYKLSVLINKYLLNVSNLVFNLFKGQEDFLQLFNVLVLTA